MSFAEVKKNFGFGCMRLPMQGEEVDLAQFSQMVDEYLAAKVSPPAPSICPSANT